MEAKTLMRTCAAATVVLMLTGCNTGPSAAVSSPMTEETAAAAEDGDFRLDIQTDVVEARALSTRTRSGVNLTPFAMGWYVYGVLVQLAAVDPRLNEHFDCDVMNYLKRRFKEDSIAKVAEIDHLVGTESRVRPIRVAAHWALESLRHIPDPASPANLQELDRRQLAETLDRLADALASVAQTVPKSL